MLLCAAAALALERLWHELQGQVSFPLLCAYGVLDEASAQRVRAVHTHLVA